MRKYGKNLFAFICLLIVICGFTGCGSSGTKEHIKTGEERAFEAREDASEVVDQINENVEQFNHDAQTIDEE